MEDFELDIVIGQGPGARSVKVPVEQFTLVGATTRAGLLTSPLRARFGIVHRLDFYTAADIEEIVRRSARILGVPLDDDAARELARRARGTPRIANRLLRRVRDYAAGPRRRPHHRGRGPRGAGAARSRRARLRRSRSPADADHHRQVQRRAGRPQQLAAATSEEPDAIEDIHEPFLIQLGFLERTPRGRMATARAYDLLWAHPARKGIVLTRRCDRSWRERAHPAPAIKSLATYVPPRLLTNADLEKLVDTSDDWIMQRTGIRERHIVDPGVATSDLATEAALAAIEPRRPDAGRHRSDHRRHGDAGHAVPEHRVPGADQDRRDQRAWGFDLSAACSAFTYSLTVGAQMVAVGRGDATRW